MINCMDRLENRELLPRYVYIATRVVIAAHSSNVTGHLYLA